MGQLTETSLSSAVGAFGGSPASTSVANDVVKADTRFLPNLNDVETLLRTWKRRRTETPSHDTPKSIEPWTAVGTFLDPCLRIRCRPELNINEADLQDMTMLWRTW